VLVDLRMPEMDGLDVLARIRQTSPQNATIVVSGTGVIQDAVAALHHGAWTTCSNRSRIFRFSTTP